MNRAITSLVMPYYENSDMLAIHVRTWFDYPRHVAEQLRVVIVDDGSRDAPAHRVLAPAADALINRGLDLRLYRVVQDIPWNQDGARNLGMMQCETPFALMTDMDHVLPPHDATEMVRMIELGQPSCGVYFMPRQRLVGGQEIPVHPNTFLMRVPDFWNMGGYDEDFCGFYGSDGNFRRCMKGAGLLELTTANFGLVVWRREDCHDANTRRYGRKDSEFWSARNEKLNAKRRGPPYRAVSPCRFDWNRVI